MPSDDDRIPLTKKGSTRRPNRQLDRLIASEPPIGEALDLVHVTSAGWAAEILRNDPQQIEFRRCRVFERDLVYFFVGRTAFRVRGGDRESSDLTPFPVAIVVRPDQLGTPAHVYPFDTGAAVDGRYLGAYQSGVFLEDHGLTPSLDSARKLISWAFGSYDKYLRAELDATREGKVPPSEYVALAYQRIARLGGIGGNVPDGRASAIEVAYGRHVPLAAHASLVVLPDAMIEPGGAGSASGEIRERLDMLGVRYVTYRWQPGSRPDDQMAEVDRLVRAALRRATTSP